jgi:hypothetical protein
MPMVIHMAYGEFVMDTKDAVTLMQILEKAERYQEKYRSTADGGSTYHIYPSDSAVTAKLITDDMYRMAKLAGKPEEK